MLLHTKENMTSIVGVLNKRAVAIAADSAVTVGDTHKVMNTGNKIFSLSKYAPVGIAIYGSASMMDTPWEVIIKCYRRELKARKFLYLKEYVDDFMHYLRRHEFFASVEVQRKNLTIQILLFLNACEEKAKKRANYTANPTQAVVDELNACKTANMANIDVFSEFLNYGYADFLLYARNEIQIVLGQSKTPNIAQHFNELAESYYYYMRVANIDRSGDSGLVFVGYGEEEIYPCLYNIVINLYYDQRLQFRKGEQVEIRNELPSASIVPFAQVEATQTVIRGINPSFYNIISNNLNTALTAFRTASSNFARQNNAQALATQIDNIDVSALTQTFTKSAQNEFFEKYTRPLVNTISLLSISDMANVAESLVALTSLVNRMSPREESVGGPVDVAVISKGDGFIWIKRKHYFDPVLNTQFFNNYNND